MDYQSRRPPLFVATDLSPQTDQGGGGGFDANAMNYDGLADNIGPGGTQTTIDEGTHELDPRQCSYPPPPKYSDQIPAQQWHSPQDSQYQNISNNAQPTLYGYPGSPMTEATDIPRSNPLSTHTGRSRSQTVPSQFPSYLRPHPYRRPPKDGIVECRNGLQDTQGDQYSRPPQPQAAASSNRLSYWPRPDYGCLVPSNGDINSPRPTCNVFNGASGTMEHNMLFDFASARLIDHRPGPQSQPPNGGTFATTDSPLHLHSPKSISMQVNGVAQLLGACQLDNPNASNTIHVEESALAVDRQFLDPAVQSSQGSSYNQHTLGSFAPTDGTGYPSTERNPWPPDRAAQMAASPDTPWSESLQTPVDSPGRAEAGSGNDALSHNPYQTPGAPQVYELHSASEGHLDHLFPHVAKPSVRQASKNRRRSDAKLYPCEFCGQTLTAMHNLKFHINSHFGIKNHKCTFCDASFNTPSDRRRHEKTCTHNGNSASPAT